jgi:hypothetical protein
VCPPIDLPTRRCTLTRHHLGLIRARPRRVAHHWFASTAGSTLTRHRSVDLAHYANSRNAPEREHRSSASERAAVVPWGQAPNGASVAGRQPSERHRTTVRESVRRRPQGASSDAHSQSVRRARSANPCFDDRHRMTRHNDVVSVAVTAPRSAHLSPAGDTMTSTERRIPSSRSRGSAQTPRSSGAPRGPRSPWPGSASRR